MRPLVGSMSSSQQTRYHTSEQTKMFICFPSKCKISSFPTNRYKVRSSRLVHKVLYWITRQSSQLLVICYYDFYSLHYYLVTSGPNKEVIPFAAKSMLGPQTDSLPQPLDGDPFFYFIAASTDIWLKIQCWGVVSLTIL